MPGLRCVYRALMGMCALLWALPVWAQGLELPGRQFPIGVEIDIAVTLPELEGRPTFELGFAPRGSARFEGRERVHEPGRTVTRVRLPDDPGPWDVVLRPAGGDPVRILPIELFFRPVPGALSVSANRVSAGEAVTVSATIPDGVWRDSPWVGLFSTGQNASGGASIADERLRWEWLPRDGAPLSIRMPPWKGTYEIRLFDRSGGAYVLDAARVEVIEDPAPGIMSLNQDLYEIGAPVTVTVKLDKDRFFDAPWVGLFDLAQDTPGGAPIREVRLGWEWLDRKTMQVTFTAPAHPGEYELRVAPSGGEWRRILDRVRFRTQVTPQPGALGVAQTDFVVGQTMTVPVALRPGHFNGGAWVGLFDLHDEPAPGQARRTVVRQGWEWVPRGGEPVTFRAPAWPGRYELRLYDRSGAYYLIDRHEFTVTAPPTPGAIQVAQSRVMIGQPIGVTVTLDPDRYYSSPYLALKRIRDPSVPGGAETTDENVGWSRFRSGERVELNAVDWPGDYEIRLYDRDNAGFVLDTVAVQVVAPPAPEAVALDRETYAPGQPMAISVTLPEGRYFNGGHLSITNQPGEERADLAQWDAYQMGWARVSREATEYTLNAPLVQGNYDLTLYDRDHHSTVLAQVPFRVEVPPRDLLRVQRRDYRIGEVIRLQTRWPEGLALFAPGVALYRSGGVLPGGGVAVEQPITSRRVQQGENTMELPALDRPGRYELRFYDREDRFYILDIEEFTVTDPSLPSPRLDQPLRLTPMPGEGREAALPPLVTPTPPGTTPADAPGDERRAEGDQPEGTDTPANPETPEAGEGDDTGDSPAADDQDQAKLVSLQVMVQGSNGLEPASRLEPGQSFVLRARYSADPKAESLSASVDLGGGAVSVPLYPDGSGTGYASGVMRVPVLAHREDAQ